LRDVFGALIGERCGFRQNCESGVGGSPSPRLESDDSRVNRSFRVSRSSEGDVPDDIAVEWGRDVFAFALFGVNPLPSDEQ
jgi:hypothetical protein